MKISSLVMAVAVHILPATRKGWGCAMQQEGTSIASEREALGFALGCLWAAIGERVNTVGVVVSVGRLGVGAVTAAYGLFHLQCFSHAVAILAGAPDAFYNMLMANHHLAAAAAYRANFPMMMLYLASMGLTNLAAALYLVHWRPRHFCLAGLGVAVTSVMVTAASLASDWEASVGWRLMDIGWQFIPLALLAGAAWIFGVLATRHRSRLPVV